VAGIAAILGGVLLGLWLAFCPQPCQWWLLFGAQVTIGAGWIAIYFCKCCPWLLGVGVFLLASGLLMLILWRVRCDIGPCRFWRELATPIVVFAPTMIAVILAIPGAAACTVTSLTVALSVVAAALAAKAIHCQGP